jgi:hypothetical protein
MSFSFSDVLLKSVTQNLKLWCLGNNFIGKTLAIEYADMDVIIKFNKRPKMKLPTKKQMIFIDDLEENNGNDKRYF